MGLLTTKSLVKLSGVQRVIIYFIIVVLRFKSKDNSFPGSPELIGQSCPSLTSPAQNCLVCLWNSLESSSSTYSHPAHGFHTLGYQAISFFTNERPVSSPLVLSCLHGNITAHISASSTHTWLFVHIFSFLLLATVCMYVLNCEGFSLSTGL